MRANHFVTLGLCVGVVGLGAAAGACGTDTSGTCMDTNSCGPGSDGGADEGMSDVNLGDTTEEETGPMPDGGGDVKTDAPSDGGCGAGLHDCNGKCVNEGNDPSNCGMCGHTCPGPDSGTGMAICNGGTCAVMCGSGTSLDCNGVCYDPHDVNHCGSCMNQCMAPTNGMATCTGMPPTCGFTCDAGYHLCMGQCLSNNDDPSMDSCVVADGLGTFVSATGSDSSGNGTKEMPFATITHAMGVAAAGNKRVYACGTFTSPVTVTSADNGVTVYGGLDCSSWAYNAATPTSVAPDTVGYALQVTGVTGVTFEDFTFTSLPGVNPSDSSIAVFAAGSSNVTLKRTTISAGAALDGQNQTQPAGFTSAAPSGSAGTASNNGGITSYSCVNGTGTSTGGAGGSPVLAGNSGNPGTPGTPNGGLTTACIATGAPGGDGSPGLPGTAGAGAAVWAAFSMSGWATAAGAVGSDGAVAQGGGGGASINANGGGGGGGAGGCGGVPGAGGTGGGSSIAMLAYQSSIDLEQCALNAQQAGNGGNGALGQAGQSGGSGAPGGGQACGGGAGGLGGSGGPAGGGAGGLSAGVVWLGTAPTINGVSTPQATTLAGVSVGTAGSGGLGGNGTACSTTGNNCGISGAQGAVVQFP